MDAVDHPSHYNHGAIECIDAIEAALGPDGFVAFLRGQVIKYQWRLGRKDVAVQDAAKADWYSRRLVKALGRAHLASTAEGIPIETIGTGAARNGGA